MLQVAIVVTFMFIVASVIVGMPLVISGLSEWLLNVFDRSERRLREKLVRREQMRRFRTRPTLESSMIGVEEVLAKVAKQRWSNK